MFNRTTRLRWRRRFRVKRRQVEGISTVAEEHFDRHLFKRIGRLYFVRRFIFTWILLLTLLAVVLLSQIRRLGNHYQTLQPVPGGTFVEGMVGSFTNANPIYASSNVDSSVSKLVFSGLFKYDQKHNLVGDLAESWTVDERGVHYVVKLRPRLLWQDGYPLTADDIVFTYKSIQNPDAKSPLASSWQGITVTAKDAQTIYFDLPGALSSFPLSMTNGIVPKHLLSGITASQLRSVSFNTIKPVGSGPYRWDAVEVSGETPETRMQQIALLPNDNYYGGKPLLNKFVIRSFNSDKQLQTSFNNQELNAMVGDTKVRQALTLATDTISIDKSLGYPVLAVKGPMLSSQFAYDKALDQLAYDPLLAGRYLDEAGWKIGAKGIRQKDGKPLTFNLYSQNNPEYTKVTNMLASQWKSVGVDAQVVLQPDNELQATISYHSYDSLVFGISLGNDPDVFPYWHSSQADPRLQNRLNFSEYKSAVADKSLEAGRTRSDPSIRKVKYRPFLEAWRNDAPAIALYQPRLLYISRGRIFGFDPTSYNSGTDRYSNVDKWMIHEARLQKPRTTKNL
ncbi:MAG: ABC transporter substrate-binding protein [Candidatus Saccharibacteria bacterium]|nr:ABC transporter substrate-binding protein [Candidatus Saccharibacteria bacterium]